MADSQSIILPKNTIDLRTKIFGRLTVIAFYGSSNGKVKWTCLCKCGEVTTKFATNLFSGTTKSCGHCVGNMSEAEYWDRIKVRLNKAVHNMETGCMEYPLTKGNTYGRISFRDKMIMAHVASYRIFCGDTNGLYVCHHCDNPPCINPEHLFLGGPQENTNDCCNKGRQAKREKMDSIN